jgi:hypothetical protein
LTAFAALWADGSSFGDPVLVGRVKDVRSVYRQQLEVVIEILRESIASHASSETIQKSIRTARQNVSMDHREDANRVMQWCYDVLLDRLKTGEGAEQARALDLLTRMEQQALRYQ